MSYQEHQLSARDVLKRLRIEAERNSAAHAPLPLLEHSDEVTARLFELHDAWKVSQYISHVAVYQPNGRSQIPCMVYFTPQAKFGDPDRANRFLFSLFSVELQLLKSYHGLGKPFTWEFAYTFEDIPSSPKWEETFLGQHPQLLSVYRRHRCPQNAST